MMKIKRAQGFHPRWAKFDFHTNPDERPPNGLSEASMKISQAPESAQNGRSDIFILKIRQNPPISCRCIFAGTKITTGYSLTESRLILFPLENRCWEVGQKNLGAIIRGR
jgi:hypothetical protein